MKAYSEAMYWKTNKDWYRANYETEEYELTEQAPERAVKSFQLYLEQNGKLLNPDKLLQEDENLNDVADLFKIFGDATRIKVIVSLLNNKLCVQDISEKLNMSQSAISHQLKLLKVSKIVKTERQGKQIFYSLDDEHVEKIFKLGYEHITEKE